jgi:hypothetical protein
MVEQKSLLFIFSSAAPQRTANREVPSQMAAHLRTGRLLDLNPGLQFHNLVSLPMSNHCSLMSNHCFLLSNHSSLSIYILIYLFI